jgi:hypothetical protein
MPLIRKDEPDAATNGGMAGLVARSTSAALGFGKALRNVLRQISFRHDEA